MGMRVIFLELEKELMKIIPIGPSVVVMVGPSGAGKSTFIEKNFEDREVVSSDALRVEFMGDLRRQDKNDLVFSELAHRVAAKVQAGQRVIIDATHLRDRDRRNSAELGMMLDVPVTYVVINRSVESKLQTGGWRKNVTMKGGIGLIESHEQTFVANEKKILAGDSMKGIQVVDTRVDDFVVVQPLDREDIVSDLLNRGYTKVRIIGDIHGNLEGFTKAIDVDDDVFLIFLGDLLDYDVRGIEIVERVYKMIQHGRAINLRGNHEKKIATWVVQERGAGFQGTLTHGNEDTTNIIKAMPPAQRAAWEAKFLGLVDLSPDWIQLGDRYLLAHAAVHYSMWNNTLFRAHRNSKLEAFALYGETSGKFVGRFPERLYNWVDKLQARHIAVVGHAVISIDEPATKVGSQGGKAIFLDTGSSKEIESTDVQGILDPPVRGHLSWMDLELTKNGKVLFDAFGRE